MSFSNRVKLLHTPVSFSRFSVALNGCVHEVRYCPNVSGYPGCQLMLAAECCHEGRHSALGGRTASKTAILYRAAWKPSSRSRRKLWWPWREKSCGYPWTIFRWSWRVHPRRHGRHDVLYVAPPAGSQWHTPSAGRGADHSDL